MGKRFLFVGAGWEQAPSIRRLRDEGHQVVATAPDPKSEAFRYADFSHVVHSLDLLALYDIAKEHKIEAVISDQCDYSRFAQAWLSESLDFPGPSLDSVAITVNKRRLRGLCSSADVPQPRYKACTTFHSVEAAAAEIGFPVIIKPVDNRGSFGVTRVDSEGELRAAWLDAVAHALSREVLVEQFIRGVVVTVDGVHFPDGHRVLGVASKKQIGGRHQVAMEICYPARFDDDAQAMELAVQRARQVADCLAAKGATGPTHTEFVFDGTDFYLLESANRGGGVHTSNVILPAHAGFDHDGYLISEALGVEFSEPEPPPNAPRVMLKFFRLPPGRVRSVGKVTEALDSQGVLEARVYVKPGDIVRPIRHAGDRNGFLIVSGGSEKELEQRFEAGLSALRIVVDDLGIDFSSDAIPTP